MHESPQSQDHKNPRQRYERLLQENPNDVAALTLGLLAVQTGELPSAVEYLTRAIAADGSNAAMHDHLGVALFHQKELEKAVQSFQRAIQLDANFAGAKLNLAKTFRSLKRLTEAEALFEDALRLLPERHDARYSLGNVLRELGRLNEAVARYQEVIRAQPTDVKAWNNLGDIYKQQGRLDEAAAAFREAVKIRPDYAVGYHNLGAVFAAQKKHDEAAAAFRQALRVRPDFAEARNALSKTLAEQGKLDEAGAVLEPGAVGDDQTTEAELHLAENLRKAARLDEAAARLQALLDRKPELVPAHHCMGLVHCEKGQFSAAAAAIQRALDIRPDADLYNSMATVLAHSGNLVEGLEWIEMALRGRPDFVAAHKNRALWRLRLGDFVHGWPEYEWRKLEESFRARQRPEPLWDGRKLPGQTLLLLCEQGLGDTIQMVRYAPLVKQSCATVVLECQEALRPLLIRCPGIDQLVVPGEALPPCQAHASLMSLPMVLGTTMATVPREVPYVFADDALTEKWRQRLAGNGDFKVGIVWQGNRQYSGDRQRSIPLRHFRRLANVLGVRLYSLQQGFGTEQLADWDGSRAIVELDPDLDKAAGPFMDTAAIMRNLDLIISSDTAIVHLAGALGAPIWIALNSSSDWRWMEEREDSPWYPTMRLFRQAQFGDWEGVFERMASELAAVVAGQRERLVAAPPRRRIPIQAPLAPGELLDKITILEIKRQRVTDAVKLRAICRELDELRKIQETAIAASSILECLSRELSQVNRRLWEIEDSIRDCEARGDFGARFIELARAVYRTNDQRTAIKRRIDEALGSELTEEKLYPSYE